MAKKKVAKKKKPAKKKAGKRRPAKGRAAPEEHERLVEILEAVRRVSGETDMEVLLKNLIDEVARLLDADRASLFLYDEKKNQLWSKVAQGLDANLIRFNADRGIAGHVARTAEHVNIPDAYEDERFNKSVDRRTGYRTRSILCVPMRGRGGGVLGVVQALNKRGGPFSDDDRKLLETFTSYAAIAVENTKLYADIEALFEAFVRASTTALEERDPPTSGHSRRVAMYALNLARAIHEDKGERFAEVTYTRHRLRALRYSALLHDYGKIGVREAVLTKQNKLTDAEVRAIEERLGRVAAEKRLAAHMEGTPEDAEEDARNLEEDMRFIHRVAVPGRMSEEDQGQLMLLRDEGLITKKEYESLSVQKGNLTPAEWLDMQSHSSKSYNVLRRIPWPEEMADVPELAWMHHEKLNGSGYPRGLEEGSLPLGARILAVVDIYDALVAEDRPYKRAKTVDEARRIIEGMVERGELDGELVEMFFSKQLYEINLMRDTTVIKDVG